MDEELRKTEKKQKEPGNVRMGRLCKEVMCNINEDLEFTTEVPEDFPDKRLPTLDFLLWISEGILLHSYYEKPMRSSYVILQKSALGEQQRMSILSNELIRRLSNIHEDVIATEIHPIIEHYTSQLNSSGYGRKQARNIIIAGVLGWMRKAARRKAEGLPFYRNAKSTIGTRSKKKLTAKTTWYRPPINKRAESSEEVRLRQESRN